MRALLLHAAELLENEAECLRESHTRQDTGEWMQWNTADDDAKKSYDDMKITADRLRDAANQSVSDILTSWTQK